MTSIQREPPDTGVQYLNIVQAARELGIPHRTLVYHIHQGTIAARWVPNSIWVVSRKEVARWKGRGGRRVGSATTRESARGAVNSGPSFRMFPTAAPTR